MPSDAGVAQGYGERSEPRELPSEASLGAKRRCDREHRCVPEAQPNPSRSLPGHYFSLIGGIEKGLFLDQRLDLIGAGDGI